MSRNEPGGSGETGPFRVLFVCTGNTCRSPLAEALARRELERLGWSGVEVGSAGVSAYPGMPASEGALKVAERRGLELAGHRSRPATPELVEGADLILAMSAAHAKAIRALGGGKRVSLLSAFAEGGEDDDGPPVPDPFGRDEAAYEATCDTLEGLVARSLHRLEPLGKP